MKKTTEYEVKHLSTLHINNCSYKHFIYKKSTAKQNEVWCSILYAAKSQFREVMDDLNKRSKVKLNYEMPDDVVEDYTYEMGRLKFKVSICQLFYCKRMTAYDNALVPRIREYWRPPFCT